MVTVPSSGTQPSQGARSVSGVEVYPVRTRRERESFILFPWDVHRGNPNWVPPLVKERRDFLNPAKNAVFDHVQVALFLAGRGGRAVGRISVAEDAAYVQVHGTRTAYFGLYESVEDIDVARALFRAVRTWAGDRGLTSLIGPLSLTLNQECGLLVDGFDTPPTILTAYNPPYYPALFERCGLRPIKDLWGWLVSDTVSVPEKALRVAERARRATGVRVRPINIRDLSSEVGRLREIYNAAWERNWGFVPMTDREAEQMARDLARFIVPEMSLVAEVDKEPVGMSLCIPDLNQAIGLANGRLVRFGLPIGLARVWRALRRIDRLRLMALGVKPGYRLRGIEAALTIESLRRFLQLGYRSCEISWTLDDNTAINRLIEVFGGRRYKTWRLYEATV